MPDFGKYSNYSDKTAFSGVVFGAQAPVLEVELNELQEIFNRKLGLLSSLIGDSLIVPASGSVSYDKDTMELSVTNCVAVSGGFITLIPHGSVVMSRDNTIAYLRLTEKVVSHEDTLTEYGKVGGKVVRNPIIDSRVGVETSRRKVITYSLECSGTMPVSVPNSGVVFIKVGELAPDTLDFNITKVVNSLTESFATVSYVDQAIQGLAVQGGGNRRIITTRTRDSTKPNYGFTDTVRMLKLDVSPYTGQTDVVAVIEGVEYDVNNMSTDGTNVPEGNIVITKLGG